MIGIRVRANPPNGMGLGTRIVLVLLILPIAVGLLISLSAGIFLGKFVDRGLLGDRLETDGVTTSALSVEVGYRPQKLKYRTVAEFDGVRVTFRTADGRTVSALLHGVDSDDVEGPLGWHPPQPGSRFSLPLEVRYLPDDPETVMTLDNALGYGGSWIKVSAVLAGVLLAGLLVAAASFWIRRLVWERWARSST